jgi:hypothetical protein
MADCFTKASWLAGLLLGAIAWAGNFQFSYALAPRQCGESTPLVVGMAIVALLLCLVGGVSSWRAWRQTPMLDRFDDVTAAEPRRGLALVSLGAAALFAVAIVLQAVASLFLNGCWR